MPRTVFAVLGCLSCLPLALDAQTSGGTLPPLLDRAREVALARSAAPSAVSGQATVYVLARGGFVIAERGTNDVSCLVNRSHPESIEPHCYDAEAARTILPIHLAEAALRERGRSKAEISARIEEDIRRGRFALPTRAAVSYMMSSAQVLHNDAGKRVGAWKPHLMIYMPYVKPEDIGVTGAASGATPSVSDPGGPLASVIIVVPDFVDPEPAPPQPR